MTVASRRQIAIGVITAVLGAVLLGAVAFTREQVIFRPEFALHEQSEAHEHERTRAALEEQKAILLDALCAANVDPSNQRCR